MRIVLDTNVFIAAFISHGNCNELLEHCALNHSVILSPFIISELREKLTGKFHYSKREADAVVRLLKSRFEIVHPIPLERAVCRDPDDDTIIATAISGECSCIVSGDKDLLILEKVQDIYMVSPADFWAFENG